MISFDDILALHEMSIADYGGSKGLRDSGLLESAIARPFQTFGGEYLYASAVEKAAAIMESIIVNHPFVDGNKRTGMLAAVTLLLEYSININASEEALYNFVIDVSTGKAKYDDIVKWLKDNSSAT
ncbi:type II toxin-antitoxin system death-on-curing family toxin [Niabella sp. W65]|nr:type II toxin-antitoxin system death-on-curing family toxin [Niabella sp. W65]MCH7361682.1 type II toxin-antitoxin system death-on-curing family toxin [Niabella sp. W65]ULT45459.1 type II toxin-antitoxin system death-on-curing family toxin [Niabella sp. I65]